MNIEHVKIDNEDAVATADFTSDDYRQFIIGRFGEDAYEAVNIKRHELLEGHARFNRAAALCPACLGTYGKVPLHGSTADVDAVLDAEQHECGESPKPACIEWTMRVPAADVNSNDESVLQLLRFVVEDAAAAALKDDAALAAALAEAEGGARRRRRTTLAGAYKKDESVLAAEAEARAESTKRNAFLSNLYDWCVLDGRSNALAYKGFTYKHFDYYVLTANGVAVSAFMRLSDAGLCAALAQQSASKTRVAMLDDSMFPAKMPANKRDGIVDGLYMTAGGNALRFNVTNEQTAACGVATDVQAYTWLTVFPWATGALEVTGFRCPAAMFVTTVHAYTQRARTLQQGGGAALTYAVADVNAASTHSEAERLYFAVLLAEHLSKRGVTRSRIDDVARVAAELRVHAEVVADAFEYLCSLDMCKATTKFSTYECTFDALPDNEDLSDVPKKAYVFYSVAWAMYRRVMRVYRGEEKAE